MHLTLLAHLLHDLRLRPPNIWRVQVKHSPAARNLCMSWRSVTKQWALRYVSEVRDAYLLSCTLKPIPGHHVHSRYSISSNSWNFQRLDEFCNNTIQQPIKRTPGSLLTFDVSEPNNSFLNKTTSDVIVYGPQAVLVCVCVWGGVRPCL
jgi:hypothetical protein